jgi:hypothetical protein
VSSETRKGQREHTNVRCGSRLDLVSNRIESLGYAIKGCLDVRGGQHPEVSRSCGTDVTQQVRDFEIQLASEVAANSACNGTCGVPTRNLKLKERVTLGKSLDGFARLSASEAGEVGVLASAVMLGVGERQAKRLWCQAS